MNQITVADIHANENLPELLLSKSDLPSTIMLVLDDGTIECRTRVAILNIILWYSYAHYKLPIRKSDFTDFTIVSPKIFSDVYTNIYNRIINEVQFTNIFRQRTILTTIENLYNLTNRYMAKYQCTVDSLGLFRIMDDPVVKQAVHMEIDPDKGPNEAEQAIAAAGKRLLDLLVHPTALKENQLRAMGQTGNFKAAAVPQIFIAYGTRSDVDNVTKKHIILNSNLNGISGIKDLAIECLSAKKAAWLSKRVIQNTQAMGRLLKVICSAVKTIYPEPCGNLTTVPFEVTKENARFLEYYGIVDGRNTIYLDKVEVNKRIGSVVNLITPIGCKHTDGVCCQCLGWGYGKAHMYLPPVNIGQFSGTLIISKQSQLVLSTKHLTTSATQVYALSENAKKYFVVGKDGIYLNSKLAKNKTLMFRINRESVNPLSDLNQDYEEVVDSFSSISEIDVVNDTGEVIDTLSMADEMSMPYLSPAVLECMKGSNKVSEDEEHIFIPVSIIPVDQPVFGVLLISENMMQFANTFINLVRSGMPRYTSYATALRDLSTLLFSKSYFEMFAIQIILKSLLLDPSGASAIPQITDVHNVTFGSMPDVSITRSIGMGLAYGGVKSQLIDPSMFVKERGTNEYDLYFGQSLPSATVDINYV